MDINDGIRQFILKSLDYYDEQQEKYEDLINSKNIEFDDKNNEIKINLKGKETIYGSYEILGYYYMEPKIWVWSWVLNQINSESVEISKNLLNYGLKLEPSDVSEHFYIKTLLVNSRILIDDEVQLDTNLAIYSYLLKGKFTFILPAHIKDNNIIIYCLIKL